MGRSGGETKISKQQEIVTKLTYFEGFFFVPVKIMPNKNEHTCNRETQSLCVITIPSSSNNIREKRSYASFENPVSGDTRRNEESF